MALGVNEAKIISMLILGLGSMIFGLLPIYFSRRSRRHPLLLTILLCFGAGVLLSTAIVHILSEVKEQLPNQAEIIFCAGFFIVYIVDQIVHLCYGDTLHNDHDHSSSSTNSSTSNRHIHYEPRCHSSPKESHPSCSKSIVKSGTTYGSDQETPLLSKPDTDVECDNSVEITSCHDNHREICDQNFVNIFGLLCALSLHSILEGLAIGVEETGTKVLLLLLAVTTHKFVVAFCLGFELTVNEKLSIRKIALLIFIFSIGSVLGIGIGIGVSNTKNEMKKIVSILQGLAGGTLLYVTVCEVLPREKTKWHRRNGNRVAGIIQFFSVVLGFTAMTLLTKFIKDDD